MSQLRAASSGVISSVPPDDPPRWPVSSGAQAFPDEDVTNWYVVHIASSAGASIEEKLSALGFEYRRFTELRKRPREKMIIVATFPGYVFVKFDVFGMKWRHLYQIEGVIDVLGAEVGTPTSIPDEVMDRLISEHTGRTTGPVLNSDVLKWETGSLLRVLNGPFASFEAVYMGYHARLVHTIVSIFGRSAPASFKLGDVELIA